MLVIISTRLVKTSYFVDLCMILCQNLTLKLEVDERWVEWVLPETSDNNTVVSHSALQNIQDETFRLTFAEEID